MILIFYLTSGNQDLERTKHFHDCLVFVYDIMFLECLYLSFHSSSFIETQLKGPSSIKNPLVLATENQLNIPGTPETVCTAFLVCDFWNKFYSCIPLPRGTGTPLNNSDGKPTATARVVPAYFFYFIFRFFSCGPFFKVFIELLSLSLLFHFFFFWLQGMWDLNSTIRD